MNKRIVSLFAFVTFSYLAVNVHAKVGIIVNKDLYSSIESSIETFISDLNTIEEKTVWLNSTSFKETNTIEELKDSLIEHYDNDDLEGAIFIGDLPIALYEVENDYDASGYAYFPIDFYYMDLNGTWDDNASWGESGRFDSHSGSKEMEIWISRITSSVLDSIGDEDEIVNKYFTRVHDRMTGNDAMERKYLIFGNNSSSDNGWPTLEDENIGDLDYASNMITKYGRPDDTKANWIKELQNGHEYVFLYEHGNVTVQGTSGEYFYDNNYVTMSPVSNVRFYNLFCCLNSRYIQNNIGGLYALGHNGLVCVGSAKAGCMVPGSFQPYNQSLGQGDNFGEAFLLWIDSWLDQGGMMGVYWHYGMTIQGVATLHIQPYNPTPVHEGYKIKEISKTGRFIAAPNPAGINNTRINFHFNTAGVKSIQLTIFNLIGNTIYNTEGLSTDNATLSWNLLNSFGRKVANGTYFAVLSLKPENGAIKQLKCKMSIIQ